MQSRPPLPGDAPESEKDKLIAEQTKTIRELEIVVRGYEEILGEPLRKVREDVEKEWEEKVGEERKKREEMEAWSHELVRQLEKEKAVSYSRIVILLNIAHEFYSSRASSWKSSEQLLPRSSLVSIP